MISSLRQTVILGPNLTGLGKRPVRTPSHHVDLLTGIGPVGANISVILSNLGLVFCVSLGIVPLRICSLGAGLRWSSAALWKLLKKVRKLQGKMS